VYTKEKTVRKFLGALVACLLVPGLWGFAPLSQAGRGNVRILDRNGENTTAITDGNTVQLEVRLAAPSAGQQDVTFSFAGDGAVLASCTVGPSGDTCRTAPLGSLGWYWSANGLAMPQRTLQAAGPGQQILGESAPLSIAPRPVILVHGFISSWETWKQYLGPDGYLSAIGLQGFALGDGRAPGKLNTGNIADPARRTNTIQQNAAILGQYIAGVRQQTGAEMVDLLVHSMGGMISRYYIDRLMQERDVAQLIMLGSPMGGSDCSVLPASLGFFLPASLEIRSSYMLGIFNRQITHRHGIQFYDLAGTAILQAYQSPCADVPNDTVVSFGSVNAIPLNSSQANTIHSELTLSRPVFEDFVRPLLQKPAGAYTPEPDPQVISPASAPLQFTRVYRGHVEPGGSTDLAINIEANLAVASFALYDPTRSTTVSVRGASGNVIELDPQTNGFIRLEDPSSMLYLGYGFSNPRPGPWKVTVLATDSTPASGADFAISVYFVGGAILQTSSSTLIPQLGEPVQFTASLSLAGEPLEISQGQILIRHPDGKVETLSVQPGAQVSASWRPRNPGVYGVDIEVTGASPDGFAVERTGFLALEVQPNPSQGQITFNLLALIGAVLVVLALIGYVFIRIVRPLFRRAR
jgi:pimeloyl-ACP methyl ester carboxylesterase